MKERPTKSKYIVNLEEDSFNDLNETEQLSEQQYQDESFMEMQYIEEQLLFYNDVIEQIKTFTEYHVLPIGEYLDSEHIQSFIDEVRNNSD